MIKADYYCINEHYDISNETVLYSTVVRILEMGQNIQVVNISFLFL